jgi:hypothetical protein
MARVAVAAAAMAVPAGTAIVLNAQPAAAAFAGIKCSGLTGTTTGTVQLTGCKATAGYTGAQPFSSVPESVSAFGSGGTVTWADGQTTTSGTPTISTTEKDGSKDATKGTCPVGTTEDEVTSTVTAGFTGGGALPGKESLEVCINATAGTVTLEPGSKAKIS